MQICKTCGVEKDLDEYYEIPSGHRKTCKKCLTNTAVERQRKDPSRQKWKQIKWKYGITEEEFMLLVEEQDNKCLICLQKFKGITHERGTPRSGYPIIDHCHNTEKVRGILCHSCNVAIGHFKDDVKLLKRAIEYLEREN